MTDREQLLEELQPVTFGIAYRMLGSVSEAEDVTEVSEVNSGGRAVCVMRRSPTS